MLLITLNERLLIASGGARHVYQHPDNTALCIKVDAVQSCSAPFVTRAETQLFEELAKQRNQTDFSFILNYRGNVETNLGFGAIFELVRDEDTGNVSRVLMRILETDPQFAKEERFKSALRIFRRKLLQETVLCRDLRPWNICVKKLTNGDIRLILIDGVGNTHKKWFVGVKPFVQVKMIYYFFSKYIYPANRFWAYYIRSRKRYYWSAGPLLAHIANNYSKSQAKSVH